MSGRGHGRAMANNSVLAWGASDLRGHKGSVAGQYFVIMQRRNVCKVKGKQAMSGYLTTS